MLRTIADSLTLPADLYECMDLMAEWTPDVRSLARPLYLALVDRLAADVREGRLQPGTRLPTHRRLAQHLRVDVTTVSRAYAEARRRGLVAGHVGRGTFVRGHRAGGGSFERELIDLTTNIPPEDNPRVRTLVARALEEIAPRGSNSSPAGYAPVGGTPDDRRVAADWLARHGLSVPGDRVLVAACAQQAFVAILSAHCEPGDFVLTESTTYPGFLAAARLLRLQIVGVEMDGAGLDPGNFERLCRRHHPKVLILVPTLHNPTGITLSPGRRVRLAAVARRRGITIIEDDAYGPLHAKPPRPIADIAPDVTYLVATASKVLMPMMRWCAIAAPTSALAQRVEASLRAVGWMQSALETAIGNRILSGPDAEAILASRQREADDRMKIASKVLGPAVPEARARGHHIWLELPKRWTARGFVEALRGRGVLVSPGELFAVDPARAMRAVRVCLGAASSRQELEQALRIVADCLQAAPESLSPSH